MPRKNKVVSWQLSVITAAIAVGIATTHLLSYRQHLNENFHHRSSMTHGQEESFTFLPRSWNRDKFFRSAYRQALRDTSDSFDLTDLIAGGHDPLLGAQGPKRSIEAFQQAINVTKEEETAWADLGWLYATSGDINSAIAAEQKAIALYRFDYTNYVLLGAFFELSKQLDEAKSAYESALLLYPRLIMSDFWHALQIRHSSLAEAVVSDVLHNFDDDQATIDSLKRREVQLRLMTESHHQNTVGSLVRAVNIELPNVSGTWELQGEVEEMEGNVNAALLDYNRASFLDSTDPLPHEKIAAIALAAADVGKAKREVLCAWNLYTNSVAPSALRREIQYHTNARRASGQLPTRLVQETQPAFDFEAFFRKLSVLFASEGVAEQAAEMEHMAVLAGGAASNYGDEDSDQ